MSSRTRWRQARPHETCPQCGKHDRCSITPDGTGYCHRCAAKHQARGGANGNGVGTGYVGAAHRPKPVGGGTGPAAAAVDWRAEYERLRAAMTDERLASLAESTGVPAAAWAMLSPGWADADDLRRLRAGGAGWAENPPDGAYVFAERCGAGRVVGLSLRAADGRKGFCAGGNRGLTVPDGLHSMTGTALIVEGASDVAACCAVGLAAVGRPSNRGGADDLASLLEGRAVLVVGENDGKAGGAWPGRDGARAVAKRIAGKWSESVQWAMPPAGAKDIREWLAAKLADGLIPSDGVAMRAAGAELLAKLVESAKTAKPEKRTQADSLVDLAAQSYRLGVSTDGEAFAVRIGGPQVAMMFRGGGSALRSALARQYRQVAGKTPSASALADALTAMEGMALDADPEPVALRLAAHDGGVAVDLADTTGAAVVVTPDGWTVEPVSPVLFRRTALSGRMPEPEQADAADLLELRRLLNVADDTWPLVAGWLVAAMLPDIPHPVLMLGGEQGTGKSSAARLLVDLIDPSAAPLRSEPRDAEQWAIAASGSWVVCLDNISRISGWLSDALCKAVTGDGLVRRKLYSDSDLAVLSFRRCIILTSIDPGAMRGDLGDRLLLVDLERIPDDLRRTEAELDAAYRAVRPRLLGALLSAVSATLAALPSVRLDRMPRMADFARVLAALDKACPELTGGRGLELFAGQRERIAEEVIESDPVGQAVQRLMAGHERWSGTAGELLAAISPATPTKGFPASARALAGRLRRVVPALRAVGIEVAIPANRTKSGRIMEIENRRTVPSLPSPPSPSPDRGEKTGIAGDGTVTVDDGTVTVGDGSLSSQPSPDSGELWGKTGDGDGSDGTTPRTSTGDKYGFPDAPVGRGRGTA